MPTSFLASSFLASRIAAVGIAFSLVGLAALSESAPAMAAPGASSETGFTQPYLGPLRYAALSAPHAVEPGQVNRPLGQKRADALARALGFKKRDAITRKQLRLLLSGEGNGGGTPEARASGQIIADSIEYLTNTNPAPYDRVINGERVPIRLGSYGLVVNPEGLLESPGNATSPARVFNYLLLPKRLCTNPEYASKIPPGIQCGYINDFLLKNGGKKSLEALYASAFASFVPFGPKAQGLAEPHELAPNSMNGTDSMVGISMAPPLWLINFLLIYLGSPEAAAQMPAFWTAVPPNVAQAIMASPTGQVPYADFMTAFPAGQQ